MIKKLLFILILLSLGISVAYADEPLMWSSQSDPVIHSSDSFQNSHLEYEHPKQYRLQLRPLLSTTISEDMLSATYGPVTTSQDNHELVIISPHEYFGAYAYQYMNPDFYGSDDNLQNCNLWGQNTVTEKLKKTLQQIGWIDVCDPDMFCTAKQVVMRGTNPGEDGSFYVQGIPEALWNDIYYLHFEQRIDGYPLEIWIENADENEFETLDANFVLDSDGHIITGHVFPGYEIVSQSDITDNLLSAYEAGERFFNLMKSRYDAYKTNSMFRNLEYSWIITDFKPTLVLTHNRIALPSWRILYQLVITDTITGEQFINDRIYSINALTGIG